MLFYRKHEERTALKCKKCQSVLKSMAAKGIEQRHLFLLYQSVVSSVTLTTKPAGVVPLKVIDVLVDG